MPFSPTKYEACFLLLPPQPHHRHLQAFLRIPISLFALNCLSDFRPSRCLQLRLSTHLLSSVSCIDSPPERNPMYKSQLQEYAQKAGFTQPVYDFEKEGASHAPRFKASVTLQGVSYESPPGFTNLKKAEQAAAQAALNSIGKAVSETSAFPSSVIESGLCKSLLQEYAQKCSLPLPVYRLERDGEIQTLAFSSTVEVGGVLYKGGAAKSKKDAEIKAAKTAFLSIHAQSRAAATALQATEAYGNLLNPPLESLPGKKRGRNTGSISEDAQSGKLKTVKQENRKPEEV